MAFRKLEQIELESQSPITEKPESELDITNNRISTNQREGRPFIRIANVGITKLQALISFLTAAVLIVLNIQYMEINKICPYNNDFDCYYRYLLCESNCGYERGLIIKDYDFIVEPRKNEFLLNTRIAEIICKLVLISLAFSVMLYLGIFTRPLRLYILIVLSNLLLLRYYRKGDSQGDYTKILSNWSFLLVFKITVSFIVLTILARLNSKAKLYSFAVFGSLILLIFSFIFGIAYRFLFSCTYWDQGLHGERIDNTIDCHFKTPNFCLYEFFGNTFDYNQWLMLTCEDRSSHWEVMDEKYPNQPRIGFPIVTHITKEERKFRNVPRYIFSHLQAVTPENEKNFEVILHRTRHDGPRPGQEIYRDPAWIEINVQFNSELVSARSKLVSESIANNVLVISMDGLSRAGAFRQLKETMKLLETTSPKVRQFFKYHSITPYTPGNMYPLFYGMKHPRRWLRPNPKAREVPSFIHEYKNKGFITGRALSLCALSNINTNYDWQHYNMIDEEPFDHVGMGWACDVNARSEAFDESTTGPLAMVRRCAYGRDVSEYVLEYGQKFWETYKDQKKFLWLDLLDFHDFTFSLGKYLDVHLSKFLKEMDLSETFVIVLGDHGQHVFKDAWWINFESVQTERAAPALFMKLPESLEGVYGDNLEKNKQRFVDAYDLNRLLKGIPNPDQVKDTMLFPLPERPGLCESVVYDQDCFCVKPKLKTESQEKK